VVSLLGATVVLCASLSLGACGGDAPADVYVAAASDTREAFGELGRLMADVGVKVEFVFGSSGLLREQLVAGAPYDVYVSANVDYVSEVVDAGFASNEDVRQYAVGVLAIIARDGVEVPASVADIATVLGDGRRVVIANPAHAPYGVAAREAMQSAGIYDTLSERLILAENVADAVRIVDAGEADVGLVALALVRERRPTIVDASLHQPIRQTAVLTARGSGNAAAKAFIDLLTSPAGVVVLRDYGFVVNDE
jgi:molybdate transport system substrate-binding protein